MRNVSTLSETLKFRSIPCVAGLSGYLARCFYTTLLSYHSIVVPIVLAMTARRNWRRAVSSERGIAPAEVAGILASPKEHG